MWYNLHITGKDGVRFANHLVKSIDEANKLWEVYTYLGLTVEIIKENVFG